MTSGEIARLDAWKQHYKLAGNLEVTEVAQLAKPITAALENALAAIETHGVKTLVGNHTFINLFTGSGTERLTGPLRQIFLATKIWPCISKTTVTWHG